MLEVSKRGPTQKNRLVGDAEMYKGLLDRDLTAPDGVKYFKDTLRLQFVKGPQSCFPLETFFDFLRARRGNMEMVKWIGNFTLLLKRLKNAWMDMWPISAMSQEQRETQVPC